MNILDRRTMFLGLALAAVTSFGAVGYALAPSVNIKNNVGADSTNQQIDIDYGHNQGSTGSGQPLLFDGKGKPLGSLVSYGGFTSFFFDKKLKRVVGVSHNGDPRHMIESTGVAIFFTGENCTGQAYGSNYPDNLSLHREDYDNAPGGSLFFIVKDSDMTLVHENIKSMILYGPKCVGSDATGITEESSLRKLTFVTPDFVYPIPLPVHF